MGVVLIVEEEEEVFYSLQPASIPVSHTVVLCQAGCLHRLPGGT